MKNYILVLFLGFALFLAGCGAPLSDDVVGNWLVTITADDGGTYHMMEISANGKAEAWPAAYSEELGGAEIDMDADSLEFKVKDEEGLYHFYSKDGGIDLTGTLNVDGTLFGTWLDEATEAKGMWNSIRMGN